MKKLRCSLVFLSLAVFCSLSLNATHTENQALLDAIVKKNVEQVRHLLMSEKVDVNYQGTDCGVSLHINILPIRNALHLAVYLGHTALVKLLLRAGADPNKHDQHNQTPLHSACYSQRSSEIISLLVIAGADINAQNNWQQTPLHIAVEERNYTVAQLLLTMPGIDTTLKDNQDHTALDIAQNYHIPDAQEIQSIAQLLASYTDQNNWQELQNTYKESKQRMINLLTFDTMSLKKMLVNYVKAHRDQFSDTQIAELPADLELI